MAHCKDCGKVLESNEIHKVVLTINLGEIPMCKWCANSWQRILHREGKIRDTQLVRAFKDSDTVIFSEHEGISYQVVKREFKNQDSFHNGYVYIPRKHPLFTVGDWYEEPLAGPFVNTFDGDITFDRLSDNYAHRILGFDTNHSWHTPPTQTAEYVQEVCQKICEAASYFTK
jgi:hypothetical protein